MKNRASHHRKRYDAEFKRESVRLADTSGKSATLNGFEIVDTPRSW